MDGSRYNRNHMLAYIASNTSDVQILRPFFQKRESAEHPRRGLELLPRISHERRQHISTDFKKEPERLMYRSEKRDKSSLDIREKLSLSRFMTL